MEDHSAPPSYHEVVTSPYQYPQPGVHYQPPGVEYPPPAHYPPSPTTYTPPPDVHYQPVSATSALDNLHPGAQYPPSPAQNLKPHANPSAPPEIEMTTVNSSGVTAQTAERLLTHNTVDDVTAERLLTNNTVDDVTAAVSDDSEDIGPCKIQFSTEFSFDILHKRKIFSPKNQSSAQNHFTSQS